MTNASLLRPDTILALGDVSQLPLKVLEKLGYDVIDGGGSTGATLPAKMIDSQLYDLIVLSPTAELSAETLLEFVRTNDRTREVPVVAVVRTPIEEASLSRFDKVLSVPKPFSAGLFAGRVATQLRLQKMAGDGDDSASLAEMNAALRDLSQRLSRERDEARKIQVSLLPTSMPKDSRFEIAATYDPLDEVGGDWYFVTQRSDGAVGLHIADVTGHGLAAAFICSMTKLAIGACPANSPAEAFTKVNTLLAAHMPEGRFITMGYLIYNPDSGELSSARAGHPPAIIARAGSNTVELLQEGGIALGFLEEAVFAEERSHLDPGDAVLLYTDGLTEAQNRQGDQFGIDRLGKAFAEARDAATSAEILQHIFSKFNEFCDGRLLKDDVTLVVLRRQRLAGG